MNSLFLLGILGFLMLLYGIRQTAMLKQIVAQGISRKTFIPNTLHALVWATQFYELVLVLKHASVVTVGAALILLAALAASRSGTEDFPLTQNRRRD